MKRLFVPLLALALVGSLLGACQNNQPPPPQPKKKPKGFYTPTPTPAPSEASSEETPPKNKGDNPPTNPPPPVPDNPPPQGNLPYATKVPGKAGFVFSPYDGANKGYIDVRGFPMGTEVKDPYTGKSFLVP
jgi:hypothetical protein